MSTRPIPRLLAAFLAVALVVPTWGCGAGDSLTPSQINPPQPPTGPVFLNLTNFQPAATVLGQPDFVSAMPNQGGMPAADTLLLPSVAEPGSLFIADSGNNRVLGFATTPTTNNAPADFVLGQMDFQGNMFDQGGSANAGTLHYPYDAVVAEGKLFVVDGGNHRVLIWNTIPSTTGVPADVVLGQDNLTSDLTGLAANRMTQPREVAVAGGRVIVSDQLNHRVLIWNTIPTASGVPADVVLGQADFVSGMPNRGMGAAAADRLSNPSGVWSDGTRLAVVDQVNSRVLIWTTFPTTNGQAADLVLGQSSLNTDAVVLAANGMRYPTGVFCNGFQFFVGDAGFNRVLVWNTIPTMNGQPADVVLGQGSFTNAAANDDDQDTVDDGVPTGRTLDTAASSFQMRVRVQGPRLYVGDTNNNRVLVFDGN